MFKVRATFTAYATKLFSSLMLGQAQLGHRVNMVIRHAILVFIFVSAAFVGAYADQTKPNEFFAPSDETSTHSVDHTLWQNFLTNFVTEGDDGINLVAYASVGSSEKIQLNEYVNALAKTDVHGLNRAEQYAFWVNLYNALTVQLILDDYPVESIRDIKLGRLFAVGPWGAKVIEVGGLSLSLDDIEHKILRVHWDDPRTHYAVNCASLGCPNLALLAFRPENTERLLDEAARAYVNHPCGAHVIKGQLRVSNIYKWYQEDFDGSEQGVIAHLNLYAEAELLAQLGQISEIKSYHYDWSLNDQRGAP